MTEKRWNETNVVVDNICAYNVAFNIISKNKDLELKSVEECQQRKYWFLWKEGNQGRIKFTFKT